MNTRSDDAAEEGEIVPPELIVKAIRDSGYKNTAYALAELIDNSIQAKATAVELICIEQKEKVQQRERRHIVQIAVIDNGDGMDEQILRKSLQFGNGTHLSDRSGIGRFGMGLPSASMSQCRRVTVYTWRNGPRNALMSYLDLDEIEQKKARVVHTPVHKAVPKEWIDRSQAISETGTLVVWTIFDEHRLTWKSAAPTLSNTEEIVGRIYRKQIHSGILNIRLCAFGTPESEKLDRAAKVNDPLYLMAPSSTPAPYDNEPMFQRWGDQDQTFECQVGDAVHLVTVRMSWAKPETVPKEGRERGGRLYGTHAKKNVGVSVVRENRELQLDPSWAEVSATEERWWGCEVEFPAALDELFGVTNNKQEARTLASMSQYDWETERQGKESYSDFVDRLTEDGDPRALLIRIANYIHQQIRKVRKRLEDQTKGTRSNAKRHEDGGSVDDRASDQFKSRADAGRSAPGDDTKLTEENAKKVEEDLVKKGYEEGQAKEMVSAAVRHDRKVMFVEANEDGPAFFRPDSQPGVYEVVLNTNHPAYRQLKDTLNADTDGKDVAELAHRIRNASDTVNMLLAAWVRYEVEDVVSQEKIEEARWEWGKMARKFLAESK